MAESLKVLWWNAGLKACPETVPGGNELQHWKIWRPSIPIPVSRTASKLHIVYVRTMTEANPPIPTLRA
jgi:hypothetical protein